MSRAGWFTDPGERYQWRWWDGTGWTERVANHGRVFDDPWPLLRPRPATGEPVEVNERGTPPDRPASCAASTRAA